MKIIVLILVSTSLIFNSVCASIQLQQHEEDKNLSRTTKQLLSAFKQCILFTFHWNQHKDYDSLTSTNFFIYYSESIDCALIVDTNSQYWNQSAANPRFGVNAKLESYPLFTKYIKVLANLYTPAATSTDVAHGSATNIGAVMYSYNVPFDYVLIFMDKKRFEAIDNVAMFSSCMAVPVPAVQILILDEREVYVISLPHVLQSAPYLFPLNSFQEEHIQRVHEMIHSNLQGSIVTIWSADSPSLCGFGSPVIVQPIDCGFSALFLEFNLTVCNLLNSPCKSPGVSFMFKSSRLLFDQKLARNHNIKVEFIGHLLYDEQYSFNCIFETGKMGFMAFVQAFDPSTWMATAAVALCMTVTIAAMSSSGGAANWCTNLPSSAAVVLMLLIERFYAYAQLKRTVSTQATLVITLWAFGAMLLSMSYSGNMISQLASPSLPPLPQDMHELSLVKYPILTTSSIKVFERPEKMGYLHYKINEYFEKPLDQNSATLSNDLFQLGLVMNFVNTSDVPIGESFSGETSKVLFAIADSTTRSKAAEIRNAISGSRLRASNARKLEFFNWKMLLAVESNSLFPIFQKFLAQIRSSGVWEFWQDKFTHEELKELIFSGYIPHTKVSLTNIWRRRITLASIQRNFAPLLDRSTSWNRIDLDFIAPAFQLLGICLLVSVSLMFFERWRVPEAIRMLLRIIADKVGQFTFGNNTVVPYQGNSTWPSW